MLARLARRAPQVRRFATEAPKEAGLSRDYLESKRYGSLWHKWFPYDPKPVSPEMGPYVVNVQGGHGETYQWCSCGEANTQPWCDNSCEKPEYKGVWKPILYMPRRDGYKLICGCKFSTNRPRCDASCVNMYAEYNPVPACGIIFTFAFTVSSLLSFMYHP